MKRLCLLSLLVAAAPAAAQPKGPPPPVYVAPVVEKEVVAGQTFVGTVKPVKMSVIGAAVDGRVEEFNVDEGDFVRKGTPLAKLRTGTLEIERDAAKAELRVREEELKELENGSRPEEIDAAKAGLSAADARRVYTKARRDRAERLFKQGGSVSQDELQEAVSAHDQAEQMFLQARANFALVQAGPRREKVDQARARVEQQKEIVKRLEDQIFLHTVRAYFDGYITVEHCEVGQWLLKGQAVVEMVKLDEVEIEVGVSEEAVSHLQMGVAARIEVAGLQHRKITGNVTAIVPQANPRTRTFPVKILIKDNIEGAVPDQAFGSLGGGGLVLAGGNVGKGVPVLKSNMVARVTLPVGVKERAVLVPKDAVVLGGPSPVVYVADAAEGNSATVRPVPVQLGIADGSWLQVKGDLRPGYKVVVQGNERIRPGQTVAVTQELPGLK